MSKRRFRQYIVEVSGFVRVPFTIKKIMVADDASQAIRTLKKSLRGASLDMLDPKVSVGQAAIQRPLKAESALRPPEV